MQARLPFLTTMSPVTIRIRCNGEFHRITVHKDAIILHNHTKTSLRLQSVLQVPARCEAIYRAVTSGDDTRLPAALRHALSATTRVFTQNGDTALRLAATTPPWNARGRNGWFAPHTVQIRHLTFTKEPITAIEIVSIKPYKNGAPIRFEGPPKALQSLFTRILATLKQRPARP